MNPEKRHHHRFSDKHFDSTQVQMSIPQHDGTESAPVAVLDMSLRGALLNLPSVDSKDPKALREVAVAFGNGTPFRLPVIPVHVKPNQGGGFRAGVQFQRLSDDFLRNLCYLFAKATTPLQLLLSQLRVYRHEPRPNMVQNFLQKHLRNQSVLHLYPNQTSPAIGTIRLHDVDPSCASFRGTWDRSCPLTAGSPCFLAVTENESVFFFSTTLQSTDHTLGTFAFPTQFSTGGQRTAARITVPPEHELIVEFIHPDRPGVFLQKRICELSTLGLSFDTDLSQDLLCPNTIIPAAVLRLPNSLPVHCSLVIQNLRPLGTPSMFRCGVELTHFFGCTRQHWLQHALFFLAPDVIMVRPWDLDTVWSVFDESGYLNEKDRSLLESQRRPFIEMWGNLADSPNNARIFLFRDKHQNKAIGTITASRIYSKTWIIHHLATMIDKYSQTEKKLDVLYQLIPESLLSWFVGLQEDVCIIGAINATRRINQWIWEQFKRHADLLHSQVQDLEFYNFSLKNLPDLACSRTLDISSPTEQELLDISEHLLLNDGSLAHHVFDYATDKLALAFWQQQPESRLIGHQRKLWVARVHGRMVGYCIAEQAQPGVNIFSMYNMLRILVLDPDPALAATIRSDLFFHAVQHYALNRIDSFIYSVGPKETPPASPHYSSKIPMLRLLSKPQHLPQIISYLAEHWH